MKDFDRQPAGEVPRGARRRARVRPLRPHEHRRARGAVEEQQIKFVNTRHEQIAAHMADGYARAIEADVGRAVASVARAHERRDRRGERGARLDPDGRDRRRRADALLRQASAPGSEPARRCVAVRDLPAVREARVARRLGRTCSPRSSRRRSRSPRAAVPARCWSTCRWTSSPRKIDVALFERAAAQHQVAAQAVARRRDRRRRSSSALLGGEAPGALRRRRHPARRRDATSCASSSITCRFPVAHTLMGKGALPDDHPLMLGMTGFWGTKFINEQVPRRRLDPRRSARASPKPTAARGSRIHVQHPADEADPHRHRSRRDRPQLSGRDRRRRRPQAGARRC